MPWIQKQGSFEPYNCILVTQIASVLCSVHTASDSTILAMKTAPLLLFSTHEASIPLFISQHPPNAAPDRAGPQNKGQQALPALLLLQPQISSNWTPGGQGESKIGDQRTTTRPLLSNPETPSRRGSCRCRSCFQTR